MPRESSFEAYNPSTLPASINGPFARKMASVFGRIQDGELDLLEVAVKCRLPATCPDDGLDALGRAFGLERYPGEGHAVYRARLLVAWPTWDEAGAPTSIEGQIEAFGVPDVLMQRADEGAFWGVNRWYSRARMRLGPDIGSLTFTTFIIGQGIIGQAVIGGPHLIPAQRRAIKRIFLRWAAAHCYAADIMIQVSGSFIGQFNIGTGTIGAVSEQIYIGRMIGQNMLIGTTPIGGYDRS